MNAFSITGLIVAIPITILGVFTLIMGRKKIHLLWGLFCFSVAWWGFGIYKIAMITDKLKTENEKLKIIIQDTGMGIPKEESPFLFTRTFERSEAAKRAYGPGRGIGLYLTAQIIQAHKGRIWAESEGRGKGSTFFIELPIG